MPLKPSAQRVQDALSERGLGERVVELTATARSAAEAAAALGCEVGQIAKSLVFRLRTSGRAVLVVACGANRVDPAKVEALLGEPLDRADADFVREQTGFAIGGVPPLGHASPLLTVVDEDLLRYPRIWAAAGHPSAVFPLTPQELVAVTGGRVARTA
ncbi:MAG: YbaK/EbsC family protein [Anaeromyxobacteraceae bacterium]|nr:YbaK/EbsC family protein [Anaeromyxobacteraceae bacterium]